MDMTFEVFEQTNGKCAIHAGKGYTSPFMAGVLRITVKMYNAMALKFGGERDEMLQAELIHFPDKSAAQKFIDQYVIPRYNVAKRI
jgi:hypothetical protein